MLCVPLMRNDRAIGVLSVLDRRDGGLYGPGDMERASLFADLAIIALEVEPGFFTGLGQTRTLPGRGEARLRQVVLPAVRVIVRLRRRSRTVTLPRLTWVSVPSQRSVVTQTCPAHRCGGVAPARAEAAPRVGAGRRIARRELRAPARRHEPGSG